MRAAEATALATGWTEKSLLEAAGEALGHAIGRHFPVPGTAVGYLGKGHNAGDALVALSILRDVYGWAVRIRCGFPEEQIAKLCREESRKLQAAAFEKSEISRIASPVLLLDALVGSGACGPLRGTPAELAKEMNDLREHYGAIVAAVDVPSGVDPDTGKISDGAVRADITFMIGNAKVGLLDSRAADAAGRLAMVDVPCLAHPQSTLMELVCPQFLRGIAPRRPFDFHKGQAGRVSIIAGSAEFSGAAVLTALGAIRAGAGLVTLHVPAGAEERIGSRCPLEVIVRPWKSLAEISGVRCDALVIGPGLGGHATEQSTALLGILRSSGKPTVIDADGLNEIARRGETGIFRENHLITPHPGEFHRLFPGLAELPRETAAREFSARCGAVLLLKGARTIVAGRGFPALWMNSTGTPGMAKGGQGDLLSGIAGALLAGGMPVFNAARLAAWLAGRAAELAITRSGSEISLSASETAGFIGDAWNDWQAVAR